MGLGRERERERESLGQIKPSRPCNVVGLEKQQIPKQHLFGLGLCGSPWNSHRFTISNRDRNRFSREHAAAWVPHNRLAAGWLPVGLVIPPIPC